MIIKSTARSLVPSSVYNDWTPFVLIFTTKGENVRPKRKEKKKRLLVYARVKFVFDLKYNTFLAFDCEVENILIKSKKTTNKRTFWRNDNHEQVVDSGINDSFENLK